MTSSAAHFQRPGMKQVVGKAVAVCARGASSALLVWAGRPKWGDCEPSLSFPAQVPGLPLPVRGRGLLARGAVGCLYRGPLGRHLGAGRHLASAVRLGAPGCWDPSARRASRSWRGREVRWPGSAPMCLWGTTPAVEGRRCTTTASWRDGSTTASTWSSPRTSTSTRNICE